MTSVAVYGQNLMHIQSFISCPASDQQPTAYVYVTRNNLCMVVLLNIIAEIRSVTTNSEIEVRPIAAACFNLNAVSNVCDVFPTYSDGA